MQAVDNSCVGVEDRDWYRGDEKRRRFGDGELSGVAIVVAIVLGLVVAGVLKRQLDGPPATYGVPAKVHRAGAAILPGVTIGADPIYPSDDPWLSYLADEDTCPGGDRLDAPLAEQVTSLACLVNYVRVRRGLAPLSVVPLLNQASVLKAGRIESCRDFNHDACGTDAAAEARAAGYRAGWGENLYLAGGPLGSPRIAVDRWLNSPGHRENLFRPGWRTQGIAVRKLERFGHERNMTLWVNQFGE